MDFLARGKKLEIPFVSGENKMLGKVLKRSKLGLISYESRHPGWEMKVCRALIRMTNTLKYNFITQYGQSMSKSVWLH